MQGVIDKILEKTKLLGCHSLLDHLYSFLGVGAMDTIHVRPFYLKIRDREVLHINIVKRNTIALNIKKRNQLELHINNRALMNLRINKRQCLQLKITACNPI